MRVDIIGKGYEVGTKLDGIIRKKMEKLDRYFGEDVTARVVCKEEHKGRYTMELTIVIDGVVIRSEETSDNMYANIDIIIPKVDRQIRKHRTKLSRQLKAGEFNFEAVDSSEEEAVAQSIVKTKTFELHQMGVQEAIDQMDLLDNKFYIYINPDTGRVNVVYRRYDKTIGLIEAIY